MIQQLTNELAGTSLLPTQVAANTLAGTTGLSIQDAFKSYFGGSGSIQDILNQYIDDGTIYSVNDALQQIVDAKDVLEGANLIAWYKLDDDAANTTVADSAGSNTGTASANTDTLSVAGKINKAFDFNGTTDYVSAPVIASLNISSVYSFSIWIKPDSLAEGSGRVLQNVQSSSDRIGIRLNNARLDAGMYNGSSYFERNNATLADANWANIVITYDTTDFKLYVNGVEETGDTADPGLTFNAGFCLSDTATDFFAGLQDDARAYNVALTPLQIKYLNTQAQ